MLKHGSYLTSKQRLYSFSGWLPGESPIELFDAQEWLRCLHGCMLLMSFSPAEAARAALEDDGLLHELLHLASDISISTHESLESLRSEVLRLQHEAEVAR